VYSWNRNGDPIAGATSSTYALTGADAGAAITVTVPGSELGFAVVSLRPAAVLADPLSRYPVVHLEGDLARAPPQAGEVDGDEGSSWVSRSTA
jgi:hypothetical protein